VVNTGAIRRFFRTPKGLLTIVLVVLIALSAPGEGLELVGPGVFASILLAGLIDALILRFIRHRVTGHPWEFPSGAVLTAMLVCMVLSAREPWYVMASTSVLAVVTKYLLRTRAGNLFNPAALAIVASFYLFGTAQSWWGALPNLPPASLTVLMITGLFIADRVNRVPLVLAYLGAYFLLFTAAAYVGDPRVVGGIFRSPDVHAALFFAFFFLTDPPTSPVAYRPQLICGVIVAVAGFLIFEWLGAVHFLLSGALVGNVFEAWNRGRPLTFRHFVPRHGAGSAPAFR
jgi:Na+-translocating ferredoxin:NAD+ oxidoreductase RnfD subunit